MGRSQAYMQSRVRVFNKIGGNLEASEAQRMMIKTTVLSLRGGEAKQPSNKKKKTKKKKSKKTKHSLKTSKSKAGATTITDKANSESSSAAAETTTTKATATAKKVISDALHEKDAAEALGDAIRDRADVLRADLERRQHPFVQNIESSVSSVGWALGTSDRPSKKGKPTLSSPNTEEEEDESGGVEASPRSVVAHYFLKSHGGAHALQSACSLLSVISGLAALGLPLQKPDVKLVLLRRSLVLAMTKHAAGLLAATSSAAAAIPHVGLSKARLLLERLARDPVSQYLFYSALLLIWLPRSIVDEKQLPWWWQLRAIPVLLLGPILLREIVSTVLVASDVLVLWTTAASGEDDDPRLLRLGQGVVDAFMSLLVTPQLWRNSSPASRQALLAKLVSRTSLALEVLVGVLFVVDVGMEWLAAIFTTQSPPLRQRVLHLVCLRLYGRLLMVRRKKIGRIAATIRGGAHHVPTRVLDALLDPRAAMGIETNKNDNTLANPQQPPELLQLVAIALGLDEN